MKAEQYSRINCLEIHGIPESPNEDPENVFVSVGKALDCEIDKCMIEACHRLGKKKR